SFRGRRRLLALAVGALLALPLGSANAATTTVIERGTTYTPRQVEIDLGDTVVWTFESGPTDSPRHTVTFDDGTDLNPGCPAVLLNDCQDTPGESVQRRFVAPGTYPYFCKIHRSRGMVGVVVVAPAAATSTTGSSTTTTRARATTTSSTARASTSSTTATTRPLATSSTMATSSTTSTTTDSSSVLLPGDPPAFPGDDTNSSAAGQSGGTEEGSGTGTVALIVALLLAFSAAGGYLLWRLRPGRA
ncbi:MAG TPA: plastocyanin/azurin family copper-binding protein, partial [Acidimicrobiia bacterium]|nr:plastocyanin/azurin family copper-binding protein [Acidimicrobiia bacterium]